MNAVNLIPSEGRRQRLSVSTSPQTLGLLGGLALVLVAAVLYISAANTVSSRKSQLAQVTAGVTQWTAAVNTYSSFVATASQRLQDLVVVRQLAASRFPWSQLLGQIATVMPKSAALSSLAATTASASGTTAAPAPSATPAAGAAAAGVPSVSLTGCAASESIVAQTMVQLHRVKGVSGVTLASATDSSSGSSGSSSSAAASSSGGGGGCPFSVQFQVSLTFSAPTPPEATTPTSPATTSTPAATASAPSASAPPTSSAAQ